MLCYTKVESCVAFVECVCAWCEFGVVLSGVFEVCVSSAIAPPIIPLLVDWLQVPVTAGGPFVGDCPLAEFYTNTNTKTTPTRGSLPSTPRRYRIRAQN